MNPKLDTKPSNSQLVIASGLVMDFDLDSFIPETPMDDSADYNGFLFVDQVIFQDSASDLHKSEAIDSDMVESEASGCDPVYAVHYSPDSQDPLFMDTDFLNFEKNVQSYEEVAPYYDPPPKKHKKNAKSDCWPDLTDPLFMDPYFLNFEKVLEWPKDEAPYYGPPPQKNVESPKDEAPYYGPPPQKNIESPKDKAPYYSPPPQKNVDFDPGDSDPLYELLCILLPGWRTISAVGK